MHVHVHRGTTDAEYLEGIPRPWLAHSVANIEVALLDKPTPTNADDLSREFLRAGRATRERPCMFGAVLSLNLMQLGLETMLYCSLKAACACSLAGLWPGDAELG